MSVVHSLMNRASNLTTNKQEHRKEINFVKNTLRLNGYPEWILNNKKKRSKTQDCDKKPVGSTVLPYIPGFTEQLSRVLFSHGIRTSSRTFKKILQILPSSKDPVEACLRNGAIYYIPCEDCDRAYIGETKRSFKTRKKEHISDVRHQRANRTALSKHALENQHNIDWKNSAILDYEQNYHKRKFIEAFYINSTSNALHDKQSVSFSPLYSTLFS